MAMLQVCIEDKLTDQLREYCKRHRLKIKDGVAIALEELFTKDDAKKTKETTVCKN